MAGVCPRHFFMRVKISNKCDTTSMDELIIRLLLKQQDKLCACDTGSNSLFVKLENSLVKLEAHLTNQLIKKFQDLPDKTC